MKFTTIAITLFAVSVGVAGCMRSEPDQATVAKYDPYMDYEKPMPPFELQKNPDDP